MNLDLGSGTRETLSSLQISDAPALLTILDEDRSAFDPWLRWSGLVRSLNDATQFIAAALERERNGTGFHLGIRADDKLVGGVVCWSIDPNTACAEVGYWIAIGYRGRGVVRKATRCVMRYLFAERAVDRVEFQCLVENDASRGLAEGLGGRLTRIHTPAVEINGARRAHALYVVEKTSDA